MTDGALNWAAQLAQHNGGAFHRGRAPLLVRSREVSRHSFVTLGPRNLANKSRLAGVSSPYSKHKD